MEGTRLNLDQPLLSVRRFTSVAALESEGERKTDKTFPNIGRPPPYRSEMKSGPVRVPGNVPFLWEKIPGKAKDVDRSENQTAKSLPAVPKPPPGRASRVQQHGPDIAPADPGDYKNRVGSICHGALNAAPLDVLDTLSRTASLFLNCRVTGLSRLDDDPDTRTSRNSSTDFAPNCFQGHENDDGWDKKQFIPAKVCGLLPCLGLNSSLCLLNLLPRTRVHTQAPMDTLPKTQPMSSLSGTFEQLDMSEQRPVDGMQMIKSQANRTDEKKELGECEGASSYGRLEVDGLLQSCEQKAAWRIPGVAKSSEVISFATDKNSLQSLKELLAAGIEKALYVDTIHKADNRKRQSDVKGEERGILTESIKPNPMSVEVFESLSTADKAVNSQPIDDVQKLCDIHVPKRAFRRNQGLYKGAFLLANLQVPEDKLAKKHQPTVEKSEKYSRFPVPPPLPKSPTDSWLCRTLHTMSAKNVSVRQNLLAGSISTKKENHHLLRYKERLRSIRET